ncbi:hypothetical protein GCM10010519_61390 [Streptomyces lactacystinicus]
MRPPSRWWTNRSIKAFQKVLYPEGIVRRTDEAWGFSQITSQTVDAEPAVLARTIRRA